MREIHNISQEMISLNQKQSDERSNSLQDKVAADVYSPEEQAILKCMSEDIGSALEILREKEADILVRRFGLNDREPMSLRQVAEVYNLTKSACARSKNRLYKLYKVLQRLVIWKNI